VRTLLALFGFLLFAALVLLAQAAPAADPARLGGRPAVPVDLAVGRSLVIDLPAPVSRVALAAPDLAQLHLLSPTSLYLAGAAPGMSSLTLWDARGQVAAVYELRVTPDVDGLKSLLHRVLPAERGVGVIPVRGALALTGAVSSPAAQDTALALARSFAGDGVVNLLQVGGVQQVLLEVKVAEMSRSALKRLGVNFTYFMGGDFVYSFLHNLAKLDNQGTVPIYPFKLDSSDKINAPGAMTPSESVNGMFRFHSGKGIFTGFLDALKEDGLVKVLAEPNLVCISGRSADFLAGGEIPVPVPQGLGSTAIEYKKFGVSLRFTPRVLGPESIGLEVAPEVSELDYSNAVNISGFVIPGITTRRASTVLELGDGQTFAVAGLFRDTVRQTHSRFPGLGDVPVLGALFSSKEFQKNESELVILVTPHLVRPLDAASQALPTDGFVEPNDWEFLVLGRMQGAGPAPARIPASLPPAAGGGMEGRFGRMLPGEAQP
jgi:pilus assembly protein CpaC